MKDAIMSGMSNIMTSIGQWKKYRILWRLQRVRETMRQIHSTCEMCIIYVIILMYMYSTFNNNNKRKRGWNMRQIHMYV